MRIYIIGLVKDDRTGVVVAYMIHDLFSGESKLVSKEQLYKAVKDGYRIIGIRGQGEAEVKDEVTGKNIIKYKAAIPNTYNRYNVKQVDELNGAGEPITPLEERKEVLLGYKGFKEKRVYRVVNSTGKTREINYDEILALAKEGKIIGAVVGTDKDGNEELKPYEHCNIQIRTSNKIGGREL